MNRRIVYAGLASVVTYCFLFENVEAMKRMADERRPATDEEYRSLPDRSVHQIIYGYFVELLQKIEENPTAETVAVVLSELNNLDQAVGVLIRPGERGKRVYLEFILSRLRFSDFSNGSFRGPPPDGRV